MSDRKRLFLLDGTALAYRAHFAMARSGLSNAAGQPTGATYGFLMTILKLIDDEQPDHLAVAFDPPGPTFRHEAFPQYKATREKMPDELVAQLDWMRAVVRALRVPILEVPGFEADDAIGTLTRSAEEQGYEVFIVTGDKDFMQLVSDRVKLYNILKAGSDLEIVGIPEVEAKFGVRPNQVIEVLALMGDASDNIPGVRGIGEKTARKLIQDHGSVEAVLANASELKGKRVREGLENGAEDARKSRELVIIRTDVPLGLEPADLELGEPDTAEITALCREFEFHSLLKRFASSARAEEREVRYTIVRDASGLTELLAHLRTESGFTIDTETTGLDPHRAALVGISFSTASHEAWYLPFNIDPPVLPGGTAALIEAIAPLLADPTLPKRGQNIKYDAIVLERAGAPLHGIAFDTMLASYCLEPESRSHGLDALALRHLDYRKIETKELIGSGRNQTTMDLLPVEDVGQYACEDADITQRLFEQFAGELEERGVTALFENLEMPLLPVLQRMEQHGIALDVTRLQRLGSEMLGRMEKLSREIFEIAGRSFNLNSPKQLGPILFEDLRIQDVIGKKRLRKTKTGYATDARTLEAFSEAPVVASLLEYRTISKLRGTYVEALPKLLNPNTGRIHTSFNQAVAATGRLSSSDPNLQNIPIRSPLGREIRRAFVPGAPGWKLLAADYSQIELRLLAHMAEDERLMQAFSDGVDIHTQTAALVFGMAIDEVDASLRSRAKAINFGIIYGMGPQRLAAETKISLQEARDFITAYFETFPGVRTFLDRTLESARELGYVQTLVGRRRRLPDITSKRPGLRVAAENMAVNTPVQGSAADLIKKAMIAIDQLLADSTMEARMLLQVHDELVFETPESELEPLAELVREAMEGAMQLRVPLKVDIGWGDDWVAAH